MPAGLADLPVVPKAGGESEKADANASAEAGQGPGSVALESELALAGPEHRLDPLADPAEGAKARSLRSGRRNVAPRSAIHCSNSTPAKPLSAMTVCPASDTRSSISRATSRSGAFAGASSKAIGVPSAEQSR